MPKLGQVTGVVTLEGQPLENALVKFQPPDGRASEGRTDAGGRYSLRFDNQNYGAKLGTHDVSISTRADARSEPPTPDGKEGQVIPAQPERVPAKYLKPGALSAEVKAGSNTFDFALTTK
ncbi:MAG: hypothetical protein C0478_01775 [Planctomyces sp.]|nr:hypothetical protein [Planctomyces sp.]